MKCFNEGITLRAISCNIVECLATNFIKLNKKEKESKVNEYYEMAKLYAKAQFSLTEKKYIKEITSPEKLFYLKGGKDWGFCKEFLELETVKKHKKELNNIFEQKQEIKELNEATLEYTKENFKNFNEFYKKAKQNRIKKIQFNIAREYLLEIYTVHLAKAQEHK